jgi:hypothetical protein
MKLTYSGVKSENILYERLYILMEISVVHDRDVRN